MDGTHASLGTNAAENKFDAYTKDEPAKLSDFAGGNDTGLKLALSFAAVACSEASRFREVEAKIDDVLTGRTYTAYKTRDDWSNLFKNWQALTSAKSGKVTVGYV